MQTTLLGLAIALILTLLTALLGPLFVDWNYHRPAFEAQASRLVGLPVRVSGPIDVRLLPSPSLLLSGIEIGADAAQQPLRAKALGIELALGSLIRGQLRATQLRLVGPQVALNLGMDGRLDVPNMAVGFNLNDVSISKLSIEDARLSLADAASGKRAVFEKLWFGGEVRSLAGVFRGEGAFVLGGELYGYRVSATRPDDGDTRIKFGVEPSDKPLLAEGEGTLSIAQGAPRFEGQLTLARPAGAALGGGKTAMNEPWRIISRVTATTASALFEQIELQYGPDERALKATGTAEFTLGETPRIEGVLSARQIDLDRVLAMQDQPRRDPVAAIRALADLFAGGAEHPPILVQIGFGIDGLTLGGGTVQSLRGDVTADAQGWSLTGVEFRAPGFTQVQMSGHLALSPGASSFSGPVEVNSVDPRAFVAWIEGAAETPSGAASPLRGRGDLTIDDSKLILERLTFEVDRRPLEGRLIYIRAVDGRKARLDAELKAADADIDAMIALSGAVFKDTKIEKPGEVSLAIDMERAKFAGLDAQRAQVKASFDAGGLKIERLSVGDFGGMKIDAHGMIDTASASPRGNVTVNLDARDLSGLTALAAKFAPQTLELVRGIPDRVGRANLRATLEVGASAERVGKSEARLDINGRLGAARINLKTSAVGALADPMKAMVQVDGTIDSDDTGMLLRITSLDRVIAAGKTAGNITISVKGPLDGDLHLASRIAASDLDARANGILRLFSDQLISGGFDLAISKADAGPVVSTQSTLPVAMTARATLLGSSLKVTGLAAQVAGTNLRGQFGLTFGPVVSVEGDIETDTVDAAAFLAAANGAQGHGPDTLWSETPFVRGLHASATGRVAFRAKSAGLSDTMAVTDLRGALRFSPSEIGVEILDGALAKGRLSGELSTRSTPDGTAAKARLILKGADADIIIPGQSRSRISGSVDIGIEVDGTGRSPKALVGSLSGTGTMTLADMHIGGLDPKAFAVAMRAVDQGLPLDGIRIRDIVTPALDGGALSLRRAEVPFTITAGQARFGMLLAQADGADLVMTGMLDLQDRTLESRILLTDGAVAISAGRPEIAIQLKGPVATPARTIDVAALTGWLALRAVEQQSKKLEAIERGDPPPITHSVPPAARMPVPDVLPERLSILPRTRPAASVAAPAAAPLPPPVDIKPAPGVGLSQPGLRSRPQERPAQILAPSPRGSSF